MKKALYIIGIIAIILISGSVSYYFITQANIQKEEQNIKNNKYYQEQTEICRNEFSGYIITNNYDLGNLEYVNYRYADVAYSPTIDSCVLFWRGESGPYGEVIVENKIVDESAHEQILYCNSRDKTKKECNNEYEKELKKLGIRK